MPIGLANIGWKMCKSLLDRRPRHSKYTNVSSRHGQRILGHRHCRPHRKPLSYSPTIGPNAYANKQAYFWVETRGKTLEEIDVLFDTTKHSSVPDVEAVRTGKAVLDVGVVEKELENQRFESTMRREGEAEKVD